MVHFNDNDMAICVARLNGYTGKVEAYRLWQPTQYKAWSGCFTQLPNNYFKG